MDENQQHQWLAWRDLHIAAAPQPGGDRMLRTGRALAAISHLARNRILKPRDGLWMAVQLIYIYSPCLHNVIHASQTFLEQRASIYVSLFHLTP